ncbi:multidrug ABC transporter ATP-binding protein [Paraoerskovia sediminicola]|uniref:Multidrug ABC transporter ATP-binding protein n=1 Tax=Paraoerskovia sediminicola TaxID=1138587 RepID=A0ABM8G1C4_9CELL|nr:ABC transporter ATP-binding protein [Paraoerskovia sediminicola]BDZ41862.1 multidrug ABC transporter ATP-binding protein [Paraoerskovia sediminicola]
MIEVRGLSKSYGSTKAVDDITFTVHEGSVTGFLGPNGAGKSTTMRMIMGLDRPDAGTATVNGRPFAEHASPLTEVGALLDAKAAAPGRSARDHLRMLAATHGIPSTRVDEVIEVTGLSSVRRKRVGGFSLGMGQRLGIATALLGDPKTLILDEPVNGLDPDGVLWVRTLAKDLAAQGRTVFLSSHLMSEVALTADRVIVIGRGRILADATTDEFVAGASGTSVRVRTPDAERFAGLLAEKGGEATRPEPNVLRVTGLDVAAVGACAAAGGVELQELVAEGSTLEAAYMQLTADSVEYTTGHTSTTEGDVA